MPQAVADRYARALAEALGQGGDFAKAGGDLDAFAEIWRGSGDLREVFDSPAVKPEQKLGVLNAILSRLGSGETTANFFRVLLQNYRLNLIDEIRAEFQALVDDQLGIVRVKIRSAAPLTGDEKKVIDERFGALTGKAVKTEFGEDANLVGGVVAEIKSTVYDGSVRGALDEIKQTLGAR